jgi:CheY-like chemotaxis protein
MLRNLVSNAIKYTRHGWVRLQCLHEAASVRIQVLDTGVGISTDQIPYIFDEFYQVGVPANSSREGYGLGLSIVQRIARLLNLNLDVRSELGRGSAFSFTLPPGTGQMAAPGDPREMANANEEQICKARVLLVEDEPAVRNATQLLLTVEGYTVKAVSSLGEALAAVRRGEAVDLLITDYHLRDGETGVTVIAELRAVLGESLKALLVTGDTSSVIRRLPQDSNLRIISKPVNADEMLGLLEALLAAPSK